jgi:isoquinoline 1-oxidoreductase subunit beta
VTGKKGQPKATADRVDGTHPGNYLLSRRGLLIGTAANGALIVGGFIGRRPLAGALAKTVLGGTLLSEGTPVGALTGAGKPDMWFEVPKQGPIILYSPKAEMGQGIHTALAQMACEELEITSAQIIVKHVDVLHGGGKGDDSRGFGGLTSTAGSNSVREAFGPLRSSAAMLREIVLIEAASQFGVARDQMTVKDGAIFVTSAPGKSMSYGEVVAAKKGDLGSWSFGRYDEFTTPPVKATKDFTLIGTDFPRVDALAKVQGTATYGYDARVEGMVFGAVVHPPRYGATLVSGTSERAQKMPGVITVVLQPANNLAAVVAATRSQAWAAAETLELLWEGGSTENDESISEKLKNAPGGVIYEVGNALQVLSSTSAASVLTASYDVAAAAHAHLEPISALAHVTDEEAHIWVSTQQPMPVAAALGPIVGDRRIAVHATYLGGGFGRRFSTHTAIEAARLSLAVGKPVQVGWTREQDNRFGPFRTPAMMAFTGTVDADGKISAVNQHVHSNALAQLPGFLNDLVGFGLVEASGAVSAYKIPNHQVTAHNADLEVPTGIWRGVGVLSNTFGLESFLDELAITAKIDPLKFRLDNLLDDQLGKRAGDLMRDVATRSEWGQPLPSGRGRGIATSMMAGSLVAAVVTVTVDGQNIKVDHVHVSADPGLVINPAGARLQITGAVMMALSSSLHERVSFKDGMAVESNFDDYPILTAAEAPPVDVNLMGTGDVPAGLGEPAIGPIGAAIANAVFAATGKRLRSLPLRLT